MMQYRFPKNLLSSFKICNGRKICFEFNHKIQRRLVFTLSVRKLVKLWKKKVVKIVDFLKICPQKMKKIHISKHYRCTFGDVLVAFWYNFTQFSGVRNLGTLLYMKQTKATNFVSNKKQIDKEIKGISTHFLPFEVSVTVISKQCHSASWLLVSAKGRSSRS